MRYLALALILPGCVIQPIAPKEAPAAAESRSCPAPRPLPRPIWPNSCVADWYAQASLPPCVEDYLQDVKSQQKKIAEKKASG